MRLLNNKEFKAKTNNNDKVVNKFNKLGYSLVASKGQYLSFMNNNNELFVYNTQAKSKTATKEYDKIASKLQGKVNNQIKVKTKKKELALER